MSGWVFDVDTTEPVVLHVYLDGEYGRGGTFVTSGKTTIERPDVRAVFPQAPLVSGYRISLGDVPMGPHRVYVYAINQPAGPNLMLGSKAIHSYVVGAYYFGMFSSEIFTGPEAPYGRTFNYGTADPEVSGRYGTDRMYGRINDAWAGVKDLQESNRPRIIPPIDGEEWWDEDWGKYRAHLKPAIGYYDPVEVNVLERHIKQATQNGLDFFAFYWYWSSVWRTPCEGTEALCGTEAFNAGLRSFLQARNRNQMHFMISINLPGYTLRIDNEDFGPATDALAAYALEPNYLKTPDGRPIYQLSKATGIGTGEGEDHLANIEEFMKLLYRKVDAVGQPPYILYRIDSNQLQWPEDRKVLDDEVDALNCLCPILGTTYDEVVGNVPGKLDDWRVRFAKNMSPCLPAGFDERPRLGILKSRANMRGLDLYPTYLPDAPAGFKAGLVRMKRWIDGKSYPVSHLLTLYAWNEWHEGGIIEPTERNKAAYLNAIADVFGLRVGNDPCRVSGECTYPP